MYSSVEYSRSYNGNDHASDGNDKLMITTIMMIMATEMQKVADMEERYICAINVADMEERYIWAINVADMEDISVLFFPRQC